MSTITANDLKTKGIAAVELALASEGEAIITVRGQSKYVVMDFNSYNRLREYELDLAIQEARQDIVDGKSTTESVAEHMKRIFG